MNAADLYLEGKLSAAIDAIAEEIRDEPNSASKRAFLVELLCFAGEFERADKQLNTMVSLDAKAALTASTWRQLVRAAQTRRDVFENNCVPELIDAPTPGIQRALSLLVALQEKNTDEIKKLSGSIDGESKTENKNTLLINQQTVVDWRDLDDLHAGVLEVLASNGKYFWVDFSQVVEINFSAPERPIDLLWRKATIMLTSGTEGEVFIPAIYPSQSDDDEGTKLGRKTEWQDESGLIRGRGLRTWLVGDEAQTIMEIESVTNEELVEKARA